MMPLGELFERDYGSAKIGVFGCGCWFYWHQFEGLKERLIAHERHFEGRLRERGFNIVSGGLVDTPQLATQTADMFRKQAVDFLICYMSTYALSSTVLPVVQRAGVPIIIVSMQPSRAMDYEHGTTFMQLEHDNQTSLPEVCYALRRANIEIPGMIVGTLYHDERAWSRVFDWCKVARAYAAVRNARIGVMGHVYEGMLDMNSDPTAFDATFGMHCQHVELEDLQACVDEATEDEVDRKLQEVYADCMTIADEDERNDRVLDGYQIHIDDGPHQLGTVGDIKQLVVVKNNLHNVPPKGIVGTWTYGWPGAGDPEHWWKS